IVDTGNSITGCSLAFAPGGAAFLLYGATTEVRLAIRNPATGLWAVQVVEAATGGSLRNSLKGRPFGTPGVAAYRGPDESGLRTVRLALRRTLYNAKKRNPTSLKK